MPDGADRWVPSVAIISGAIFQDWHGTVSSQVCRDCPLPDPEGREEPLRPSASGDDRDVTSFFGGSVELMSPQLPVPGSPRFFVGGEVAAGFGATRSVALEGDPSTIGSPLPEAAQSNTPFGDDIALGQGSKTEAEFGDLVYGAYAGLAFPLELYERALRIKPYVAWTRYEIDVSGAVVDADCLPILTGTRCNDTIGPPPAQGFLRSTELFASTSETFDAIGPGLDIEMDTGRLGPLGSSIFIGGRVYRVLGNREIKFSSPQRSFDDILGSDTAAAQFSFDVDEWIYRFGVGFRLQWLGFDD